jgi:hypothetical protein
MNLKKKICQEVRIPDFKVLHWRMFNLEGLRTFNIARGKKKHGKINAPTTLLHIVVHVEEEGG